MASTIDGIKNDLIKALNAMQKKTSAYDTEAEVVRIEGNTAWVHIGGGVTETPVQLTINAQKGDKVQVRVSNEGAWIMGNATAPPTDDKKANEADAKAAEAKYLAVDAVEAAVKADVAAQDAVTSAEIAKTAAETAQQTAESIEGIAIQAQESANSAETSAASAYNSANQALSQLSFIEDIVGVLDLVSQNGVYEQTTDLEVVPDKWYFTRTGSGTQADPYIYTVATSVSFTYYLTSDVSIDPNKTYYTRSGTGTEEDPYVYTVVENPDVSEIGSYYENTNENYYVLTGIDQAIQNYVSSHLALVGNSLFLQTVNGDGSTRLELNTQNGMTLYDQTGNPVARYGTNTIIGNEDGFHVKIDDMEIGFYQQAQKVAYINGNKLYITQSVVLQQMDVGKSINDGGLGQWSWKVHKVDGQNNLYLKWLG